MDVNIIGYTPSGPINRDPQTIEEEVYQNVRTIILTDVMSVPLDRGLGIDTEYLDVPLPRARAYLTDHIMTAVAQSEPRAEIRSVEASGSVDGDMTINVLVRVRENA